MRSVSPAHDVSLSQVSLLKRLGREGPHAVADLSRLDKITRQCLRPLAARSGDPALCKPTTAGTGTSGVLMPCWAANL